jgi:hypothetical protein
VQFVALQQTLWQEHQQQQFQALHPRIQGRRGGGRGGGTYCPPSTGPTKLPAGYHQRSTPAYRIISHHITIDGTKRRGELKKHETRVVHATYPSKSPSAGVADVCTVHRRGWDGQAIRVHVAATKRGTAVLFLCARPPVTTLRVPPLTLPPHPMCHRITKKVPKNETGSKNLVTRHPHRAQSLPIFHAELSPTSHTEHCRGLALRVPGLYDVVDLAQGTRRRGLCVDGAHEWQHHSWSRGNGRVCMCEQGVLDCHKNSVHMAEDTLSLVDVRFIAYNKYPDNSTHWRQGNPTQ